MPSPPEGDASPETTFAPDRPAPEPRHPPEAVVEDRHDRTSPREAATRTLHIVTVRAGGPSSWRREEIYDPDGR